MTDRKDLHRIARHRFEDLALRVVVSFFTFLAAALLVLGLFGCRQPETREAPCGCGDGLLLGPDDGNGGGGG